MILKTQQFLLPTNGVCPNVPEKELDHPCDLNPQKRVTAKQYCSYLFSNIFTGNYLNLCSITNFYFSYI